jgi:hypothetical protein
MFEVVEPRCFESVEFGFITTNRNGIITRRIQLIQREVVINLRTEHCLLTSLRFCLAVILLSSPSDCLTLSSLTTGPEISIVWSGEGRDSQSGSFMLSRSSQTFSNRCSLQDGIMQSSVLWRGSLTKILISQSKRRNGMER